MNGKNVSALNFHFFITDKLLVFTQNKVASRFVDSILQPFSLAYATQVSLDIDKFWLGDDPDTKIKDSLISFYNNDITAKEMAAQRVIIDKELKSIVDKKCKKDIIFLIREPLDRLLTGCAQEFYGNFYERPSAGFDFKLKLILKNFVGGDDLYRKLNMDIINFAAANVSDRLTEDEIIIIKKLFLEYLISFAETEITHTGHTNRYIPYLYDIITSGVIDSNKVKVVDISTSKKILVKTLANFHEVDQKEDNFNSNSWLSQTLYDPIDSNEQPYEAHTRSKILKLFESHLQTEIYFYQKFLKSSFIVKNVM